MASASVFLPVPPPFVTVYRVGSEITLEKTQPVIFYKDEQGQQRKAAASLSLIVVDGIPKKFSNHANASSMINNLLKTRSVKVEIVPHFKDKDKMWVRQIWVGYKEGLDPPTEISFSNPEQRNVGPVTVSALHFDSGSHRFAVVKGRGKTIAIRRSEVFVNGLPYFGDFSEHCQKHLYCDACPMPENLKKDPSLKNCDYLCTTAWIGQKPNKERLVRAFEMKNESRYGYLSLLVNRNGQFSGGVVTVCQPENAKPLKVWFDNSKAFLCGVSLDKVDLSFLAESLVRVIVVPRNAPVSKEILALLTKYYGQSLNEFTLVEAKTVAIGQPQPSDMVFEKLVCPPEVIESYLPNLTFQGRPMTSEDFRNITGSAPTTAPTNPNPPVRSSVLTRVSHMARIIELRKPSQFGGKTTEGVMQITSGPFTGHFGLFSCKNVLIFGHSLGSANLMDFYNPEDEFNVTLKEPVDAATKAEIVRLAADKKMKVIEVQRMFKVSQGFILKWMQDEGMAIPDDLIKVNNTFEWKVDSAWIGEPQPLMNDRPSPEFDNWLKKHNFTSKENFYDALEPQPPYSFFFPIRSDLQRLSAVVQSVYPPLPPDLPTHFGLLRVTDGSLASEIIPFEPDDLYMFYQNMGHSKNMSSFLIGGDQVTCDVRRPHADEESRWKEILKSCCDERGQKLRFNTRYVASLVYIGGRPGPPRFPKFKLTPRDVFANPDLTNWLTQRKVPVEVFVSEASDLTPVQTRFQGRLEPVVADQPIKEYIEPISVVKERFRDVTVERSRDVTVVEEKFLPKPIKVEEPMEKKSQPHLLPLPTVAPKSPTEIRKREIDFEANQLTKALTLTRRIMSCSSPEDPKVKGVVTNDDELEFALFMSKTLIASIMSYTKDEAKQEKTPEPIRTSRAIGGYSPEARRSLSIENPFRVQERVQERLIEPVRDYDELRQNDQPVTLPYSSREYDERVTSSRISPLSHRNSEREYYALSRPKSPKRSRRSTYEHDDVGDRSPRTRRQVSDYVDIRPHDVRLRRSPEYRDSRY